MSWREQFGLAFNGAADWATGVKKSTAPCSASTGDAE
jgi:hypothetical protein